MGYYKIFYDQELFQQGPGSSRFSEESSGLMGGGCPSNEPSSSPKPSFELSLSPSNEPSSSPKPSFEPSLSPSNEPSSSPKPSTLSSAPSAFPSPTTSYTPSFE